jgi:AcrR family transcriptional regulator
MVDLYIKGDCMTTARKISIRKGQTRGRSKDLMIASTKNAPLVENRHQQIVDGACKVFFEKGYHPTTIRDIAKACGMSMGQLYHYIRSKDDVLYLIHKHMHKVWYDYLKRSNLEQIDDPVRKLTEALKQILRFQIENKKLIQFVYSESKYLDKKHFKVVLEMDYKHVIGFWRGLLEDVNKKKSVKGDLDILASLVAFLLVFLPLRGWTLRDKPTKKTLDSLQDFILRGLGVTS